MDISSITSSIPGSVPAPAQTSTAVQLQSLVNSSESALFGSLGGASGSSFPDLSGFTATAQAYSLYTDPGMLQQLATGSGASGTTGASAATRSPALAPPAAYAFNPFDQASWWTDPSASVGTTVDASA